MKSVSLIIAALLTLPLPAQALPYAEGVLTVGSRDFFVGDLRRKPDESGSVFSFNASPWLEIFLDQEPLLFDRRVRFQKSGVTSREIAGELPSHLKDSTILETDPQYQVEGFTTYVDRLRRLHFFPDQDVLTFSVTCSRDPSVDGFLLNLCGVHVAYPYATHVVLTANQYFPGNLSEIGKDFEGIARRMVEIAICLDVTDRPKEDRTDYLDRLTVENPTLTSCKIDLSS